MRAAAMLLLELLEDMLDFARIEAGGVHSTTLAFSLRDTVNDVFAVQGTRAAVRGLALVAEVDPALPDAVQGDRRKLSQILLNLVGNAIKFSDEGAVTVRVRAGTQPGRGALRGRGPRHRHRARAPAGGLRALRAGARQRPPPRRHRPRAGGVPPPGRGHGRRDRAEERAGAGHHGELRDRAAGDRRRARRGHGRAGRERAGLPGHRVLVVEDDEVNRMVVERFLDALGQQAVCAPDIHNALRLLHERPIDLALIDMNLPDGDGRELLARLRALPAHARTPAVLMSAHIPRREVDALLEAGFAAFLSKPFSRQRLRALLAELLAGGAPRRRRASAIRARPAQLPRPARPRRSPSAAAAGPEAPQAEDWIDIDFLRAEQEALGEEIVADIVRVFRTQGQPLIDALLAAARAGDAGGVRAARPQAARRRGQRGRGAAGGVRGDAGKSAEAGSITGRRGRGCSPSAPANSARPGRAPCRRSTRCGLRQRHPPRQSPLSPRRARRPPPAGNPRRGWS